MASGLPVIVPDNKDAGYMDFTKDAGDGVIHVKTKAKRQADPEFFCEGNLMPDVDQKHLQSMMRHVYNESQLGEGNALPEVGASNRKYMEENWHPEVARDAFYDLIRGEDNGEKES
jgi:hypothetical protein